MYTHIEVVSDSDVVDDSKVTAIISDSDYIEDDYKLVRLKPKRKVKAKKIKKKNKKKDDSIVLSISDDSTVLDMSDLGDIISELLVKPRGIISKVISKSGLKKNYVKDRLRALVNN